MFIIGPLILIIAILYKLFPPKKINWFYGYRTPTSKRSQETWDEANRYSANLLLLVAIGTTSLQTISYFTAGPATAGIVAAVFLVVGMIASVIKTEIHLRKHFDREGRRRSPSTNGISDAE